MSCLMKDNYYINGVVGVSVCVLRREMARVVRAFFLHSDREKRSRVFRGLNGLPEAQDYVTHVNGYCYNRIIAVKNLCNYVIMLHFMNLCARV